MIKIDAEGIAWVWYQSESDHRQKIEVRMDVFLAFTKATRTVKQLMVEICTHGKLSNMTESDFLELQGMFRLDIKLPKPRAKRPISKARAAKAGV